MKIFFASDHAGFKLKAVIMPYVKDLGHEVIDCGPLEFNADDDYPDFVSKAAEEVSKNFQEVKAIILGASGQGEAIVANRFPNVRAAVFYGGPDEILKLSREHNDANVLSLGALFLSEDEAKKTVKMWLETPFSGEERHVRRIQKIETKL